MNLVDAVVFIISHKGNLEVLKTDYHKLHVRKK